MMKFHQRAKDDFRTRSEHVGARLGSVARTDGNRVGGHRPSPSTDAITRNRETDPPDSIIARRNVLTAMWAGRLLGLAGAHLTAYAYDGRFLCRSDARLLRMIAEDLTRAGHPVPADEIQQALSRYHRVALHQSCSTD